MPDAIGLTQPEMYGIRRDETNKHVDTNVS